MSESSTDTSGGLHFDMLCWIRLTISGFFLPINSFRRKRIRIKPPAFGKESKRARFYEEKSQESPPKKRRKYQEKKGKEKGKKDKESKGTKGRERGRKGKGKGGKGEGRGRKKGRKGKGDPLDLMMIIPPNSMMLRITNEMKKGSQLLRKLSILYLQ
ncbi:hypothetical protein RhiirA1_442028 [Rhizophagus irregularis]|uniref:Uncharacterized protein n=1 Tax=Rhizophagus irregularis TaxID=588596 RepID=A0A2I1FBF3_9GLOM|nr:hypothetical protein RhiirA1_442028 [Rhizophagus irregularis]PKY31722.1 hypothetical protein RhiirB3_475306 [Rhizophagus irregularis]